MNIYIDKRNPLSFLIALYSSTTINTNITNDINNCDVAILSIDSLIKENKLKAVATINNYTRYDLVNPRDFDYYGEKIKFEFNDQKSETYNQANDIIESLFDVDLISEEYRYYLCISSNVKKQEAIVITNHFSKLILELSTIDLDEKDELINELFVMDDFTKSNYLYSFYEPLTPINMTILKNRKEFLIESNKIESNFNINSLIYRWIRTK